MAQNANHSWFGLGAFIAISCFASLISGSFWGKKSDKNSQKVMQQTAGATAIICAIAAVCYWLPEDLQAYFYGACFFFISVVHQGVRLARSAYVVDLGKGDTRTAYVTVSNTLIGLLLLIIGLISAALSSVAVWIPLLFFFATSVFAVVSATKMTRV